MSITQIENKSNDELRVYLKSFLRGKSIKSEDISYQRFLQDKLLVAHAVKKGVPAILFKEIKTNSPFDDEQWSNFLHINIRTLQRYKGEKSHVFKPIQSERIFELAEVISIGQEVFDSTEDFNLWLNSPSPALGNEKPIELLDTSYGKDLVLAELNRIEHGIFI
ncbi:type II toxin-antitoxin system Xre/ParS family antitoxin [Marivirga sp.]|uniref:type II RES/Xre toxin-antitoxin system antitoxin n=1 Tax=Marivirga sp. TaxID=2018662 RepID=UPI002D7EEC3E|nr:antitoxin Xre/MbcA/ParS toxin-binding domain-containing protein [Marivirga sp.]HET8859482.1 antitoxin Xre/MbcA/ParS toxin-binding domain-containing protein [Marivirga sp.]